MLNTVKNGGKLSKYYIDKMQSMASRNENSKG